MLGYYLGIFGKTFNFKEKRIILSMNQSHIYSDILNQCRMSKADNRASTVSTVISNSMQFAYNSPLIQKSMYLKLRCYQNQRKEIWKYVRA